MKDDTAAAIPESLLRFERAFVETGRPEGPSFEEGFELLLEFQRSRIRLYDQYLSLLGTDWRQSPHIPVEVFRRRRISAVPDEKPDAVFVSSGTTSPRRSHHEVYRLGVYELSVKRGFEHRFGTGPFTIAAVLPVYQEAGDSSSLLHMVRCLIRHYGDEESGFFFGRTAALQRVVDWSERYGTRLMIFGVAFGLLDLLAETSLRLPPGSLVVETGGMKTRRREIARSDLHLRLAAGFGIDRRNVLSEYGMTELLSQCYTRGGEVFRSPPWLRVEIRNPENPLEPVPDGRHGVLAFVDLANIYSLSAILTEDVGVREGDGFRVLGRLKGAQLRGCNLLLEDLP